MALRDLLVNINARFNRAPVDQADRATDELGNSANRASKQFDKLAQRINNIADRASKLGSSLQSAGSDFAAPFLAGGAAIGAGLGLAVKTAADFEQAMDRVGALSGASEKEVLKLTETARKLGETTSFSASQAAEGMSYLAMAGYKSNEVIDAMPGLLSMAAAGQTELGETADIASNILSGFGLQASETSRVADILTKTFTSSNTDLQMLGYTMKYVAPVAKAAGQSLESMSAAAGILGNAGIQADSAGTALRMMLIRLANPPKMAKDALDKLGISVSDQNGNMKDLSQIIGEMSEKTKGMTEAERLATVAKISGVEASAAMLALMDAGQDAMESFTKELEQAGGTADRIAKQQLDNLNGRIVILKSGIEAVAITMGNFLIPYVEKAVVAVQWLVDKFNSLPESQQRMITMTLAIASAVMLFLGGLGMMVVFLGIVANSFAGFMTMVGLVATGFGKIAGWFGKIRLGFTGLASAVSRAFLQFRLFGPMVFALVRARLATAAITALSFAIRMLGGPIGIAITAVMLLGSYLVKLYKENEKFRDGVNNVWAKVQEIYDKSIGYISQKFSQFVGWLQGFKGAFQAVGGYLTNSFKGIGNTLATLSPLIARFGLSFLGITGPVGWVIAAVISLGSFLFKLINGNEQVKTSLISAWDSIKSAFQPVVALLGTIGDTFITMLSPAIAEFASAFSVLGPEFQKTGQVIADSFVELGPAFAQLCAAFVELGSVGGELFSTLATTLVPLLSQAAVTILPMLGDMFVSIIQLVANLATTILPVLAQVFTAVFSTVLSIIQMVVPLVIQLISAIVPIVLQIASMILPLILQVVQMVFPMILTIIQAVLPIVVNLLTLVIQVVLQIAQAVLPLVLQVVQAVFPMILSIIQAIIPIVTGILTLAANIITTILIPAIQIILKVVQFVFPLIMTVIQNAIAIVTGIIKTASAILQGDWSAAWEAIKETATTIMDNIIGFFKSIDLLSVGKDMIQGLIDGIGSMGKAVVDKVTGVVGGAIDAAKKFLGINSPSRVFMEFGEFTGEGYNIGVERMMKPTEKVMGTYALSAVQSFESPVDSLTSKETQPFDPIAGYSPSSTVTNQNVQGDTYNFEINVDVDGDGSQTNGEQIGDSIVDKLEEFFGSLNRRMPTPQEL
ncbi:phage tail tape measure protein [Mycobacteroides abscessus]|uniref:phage tail tape measure protein n=1 Tax=Mycobacteroides abscessus TaxID=36809 RepID=UPI000C267AFD